MADGEQPSRTWDNRESEDVLRLGRIGVPLLFKGCLVAIKGDWKEVAETFQFSNWVTKTSPCYSCWCTTANYLLDDGFSQDNHIWPAFTMQDYEDACAVCEQIVVVKTLELVRRIRGSLFFDRRDGGAHGRALRRPVAGTLLLAGDRLEPTPLFQDTSLIDGLTADDLPIKLTFWRVEQVRVKHRNPLFNRTTGATPELIAPDQLHALNLGPLQRFSQELLWGMLKSSVWVARGGLDQKTFVEQACVPVRAELKAWEYSFNKAHPLHKPTIVQPITPSTIGTPTHRLLKLKAAEMKYFFFFLHSKLQEIWTMVHNGQLWLGASQAMWDLLNELDGQPWKLTEEQVKDYL